MDLTQLDRQISGDNDLTVKRMPHDRVCDCWGYTERAPGCSSVISLDRDAVTGWFRDLPARRAITRLMGLNLHEVGHVLFTPSIDLDAMGP